MKRLNSIDIARAMAILLMVMCHFTIYITHPEGAYRNIFFFSNHILGDFPAAMFLFLVGVSLFVSINRSRQYGLSESSVFSRLIIRGSVLFIFGLIYESVVWGYSHSFDWDILTTIGSCILVLAFLRNLSSKQLVVIAIVVVILSPYLRHVFGYPAFWEKEEYMAPWTIREIFGGYFLNGFFPLLPWMAYSFIGYAVGKTVFVEQNASILSKNQMKIPIIGAILMVAGFSGFLINYYIGLSGIMALYVSELSFYPLSSTLFLIEGGFILLLFGLLNIRFDTKDIRHPVMNVLRRYSRYALSVYVIHHVLLIFVPRRIGLLLHQEDYFYYQNIFEPPTGLFLSVIFLFVFYPVLILWDKVKGIGSFEWAVSKFVPQKR